MGESQHSTETDAADSQSGGSRSDSSVGVNEIVIPADAVVTDNVPTVISKSLDGNGAVTQTWRNDIRGRTLAHFELIEPIGVGGMAAVIQARDQNLDRLVALKILPPEMAADPENVKRFHQEARSGAKLDHENIAHVYYCGEDKGLHFIAYEYVDGSNLMALLRDQGPIPVANAIRHILDVTAGLAHAASQGVVHRDVKPSNIIIEPSGRAKLVDMGLARILETHKDKGLTHSGVTLGTFDYISPEQALEPRDADLRSDVYSLGCTFYHMLTGKPPVPDGTAAKKLRFHQHEAPLDPREINPSIPDSVAAILAKMMAKNPLERYQQPDILIQHLRQVARKLGVNGLAKLKSVTHEPLPHEPRTKPFWWVACAGVAFAVLLAALSFFPRDRDPVDGTQSARQAKDTPSAPGAKDQGIRPIGPGKILPEAGDTIHIWNSADDLKKLKAVFESDRSGHVVKLHDTLDLSDQYLVFAGGDRTLIVESSDDREPRTIRLKYTTAQKLRSTFASMVIDGGRVLFRNLRFEVESNVTPMHIVSAVVVKDAVSVTFDRCTFVQTGIHTRPFLDDDGRNVMPIASIALIHQNGDSLASGPQVNLQRCYFEKGQVAVALRGAGRLSHSNCAFGPHMAIFHLFGKSKGITSQITMNECSAHIVHGPVFRIDDQATCRMKISNSLFSQPSDASLNQEGDVCDFIYQRDAKAPAVIYEGHRNVFHNLNAFWVWPQSESDPMILAKFAEFKAHVEQLGGHVDAESHVFAKDKQPWLEPKLYDDPGARSFRIDPLLPELRQLSGNQLTQKAIGIQECAWGPMVRDLPVLQKTQVAELATKELIFNPQADNKNTNEHRTLQGAVLIASNQPGEHVIRIMQTSSTERTVKVESVRLNKPGVTIILKPHKNHRPILTLAKTQENEAEMFYVSGGMLKLQDLEFTLYPDRREFNSQSIVKLGSAGGRVSMKNCVVTMKDNNQIPLSVVMLRNPKNLMPMGQAIAPIIKVEQCFIRGEGDFLRSDAGQSFQLQMRESLLGLKGSLVDVYSGATAKQMDAEMVVDLSNVSAFFDDELFIMRSKTQDKYIVPMHLKKLQNCLFHSLNAKSLIYLNGFDVGVQEEKFRQFLKTSTIFKNAYSNMTSVLAYNDGALGSFTVDWYKEDWLKWTGENDSIFPEEATFKFQPLVKPLSEVSVGDFQVETPEDLFKGYGASPNMVQGPSPNAMPNPSMNDKLKP